MDYNTFYECMKAAFLAGVAHERAGAWDGVEFTKTCIEDTAAQGYANKISTLYIDYNKATTW